jgi:hypothetical protein
MPARILVGVCLLSPAQRRRSKKIISMGRLLSGE